MNNVAKPQIQPSNLSVFAVHYDLDRYGVDCGGLIFMINDAIPSFELAYNAIKESKYFCDVESITEDGLHLDTDDDALLRISSIEFINQPVAVFKQNIKAMQLYNPVFNFELEFQLKADFNMHGLLAYTHEASGQVIITTEAAKAAMLDKVQAYGLTNEGFFTKFNNLPDALYLMADIDKVGHAFGALDLLIDDQIGIVETVSQAFFPNKWSGNHGIKALVLEHEQVQAFLIQKDAYFGKAWG